MTSPVVAPALVELAVITYRDVKNGSSTTNPIPHLPLPSQYVSVAVVYGLLGALPERAHGVAALAGWGFVVATLLNLFSTKPNATPGAIDQVKSLVTPPATPSAQSLTEAAQAQSTGGGTNPGEFLLGGLGWVWSKVS